MVGILSSLSNSIYLVSACDIGVIVHQVHSMLPQWIVCFADESVLGVTHFHTDRAMFAPPSSARSKEAAIGSDPTVSAVIPTLNESKCIANTLRRLKQSQPPLHEMVVVDGGSVDDTVARAKEQGARVVMSRKRGRAAQMNAGAKEATGEVLWFVHADTLPPMDGVKHVRQTLRHPQTVLGGFLPKLVHNQTTYWLLSFHNLVKTYYAPMVARPLSFARGMRLLFGDQAMFCRKADFDALGGFNEKLPIMEDADLCLRMHNRWGNQWNAPKGRIKMVNRVAETSARRIAAWGNLRATQIHFIIALRWYAGASSEELCNLYRSMYTDDFR